MAAGLQIVTAERLPTLAHRVAELFERPSADPFEPEYVVVPTLGIRDSLRSSMATALGVTCNVRVVFPGEFIRAALGQEADDRDGPWSIGALTWAVVAHLRAGAVHVPGRAGVAEARHIAALFDRYAVNRPSIIQQWALGINGDGTEDQLGAVVPLPVDQQWQAELWRGVRAAIGVPHLAEQLPALLAAVADGSLEPSVPQRVVLFGVTTMPPAQVAVVRALSAVRDVYLMMLHPSPAARRASKLALGGRLVLRRDADAVAAVRHSLTRSWGRSAMETAVLLAGVDGTEPSPGPEVRTPPASLLGVLQQAIIDDDPSPPPTPADATVQVHTCHGTIRQLEVLRDVLGHLFVGDATLQPHDVLIVCPDLARFAPVAEAVFARGDLPVPLRISDVAAADDNAVATTLLQVLTVVAGRCTVAELLDLAALAPVRRALGLTTDDLAVFQTWTAALGTRWGLDGDHRQQFLSVAIDDATWSHSLDRLLVGAAMPAPNARSVLGGIAPYDDIDGPGLQTAGRLARLVGELRALRTAATSEHSVDEWVAIFAGVVDRLCDAEPDRPWDAIAVRGALATIARSASLHRHTDSIAFGDAVAVVAAELAERRGRLSLRSGKVSMTSMMPVRSVTHRVICVIGVEEGSLRGTGSDGDDVLGTRPCVGERDARTEGKALLLDALMAAEDRLILTCDGHDVTSNRALPLPVVISELLDAVRAVSDDYEAIVHSQPRYGYAETNLDAEHPFTFDRSMLRAAQQLRSNRRTEPGLPQRLATVTPRDVTLTELVDACYRPARVWLRDRLDVALPHDSEPVDPHLPLTASKLQHAQLGRSLLAHRLGGHGDEHEWRVARRGGGMLPPRQLAIGVLDAVSIEVSELFDAALARHPDIGEAVGTHTVDIDLVLRAGHAAPPAEVRLVDRIERLNGTTMLQVEFSRPHHRFELAAALRLAALVVAYPEEPWRALIVTRGESSGRPPTVIDLQPVADDRLDAAEALLAVALDLRLQALREPIPLFERSSRQIFDEGTLVDETLFESPLRGDRLDLHNGFVWGAYSAEEMLAVPWQADTDGHLRPVELAGFVEPSRAATYARYLWSAVRRFVPGGRR